MLVVPSMPRSYYALNQMAHEYEYRLLAMNPFNDSFLSYIQPIMLGILTGIAARPPNLSSQFWQQMPESDQMIAQIEGEVLSGLFKDFYAIQCHHIATTYLDFLTLEEIGSKQFQVLAERMYADGLAESELATSLLEKAAANNVAAFTPLEIDSSIVNLYVPEVLVPSNWESTMALKRGFLGNNPSTKKLLRFAGDNVTHNLVVDVIRRWQDQSVPVHFLSIGAYNLATWELAEAAANHNALIGPAARSRALLVDSDIPLVTLNNFHFWWAMCGIEAKRFDDLNYIAFTHPHMPVTKDHQSNQIQSEDSHANHSLPGRSGGHIRTDGGKLIHGRHYMWSYFDDSNINVLDVENSMLMRPAKRLRAGLPGMKTSEWDTIWGKQVNVVVPVQNPWENSGQYLEWHWMESWPISTSMRHIAKSIKYHFMFTDSKTGHAALNAWRDSMLLAARQWCAIMQGPGRDNRITCIMAEQHAELGGFDLRKPDKPKAKGAKFVFDFDSMPDLA